MVLSGISKETVHSDSGVGGHRDRMQVSPPLEF